MWSPLAFVVTSVTDCNEHVAAQVDSSLSNRRASLSRSLATDVNVVSVISLIDISDVKLYVRLFKLMIRFHTCGIWTWWIWYPICNLCLKSQYQGKMGKMNEQGLLWYRCDPDAGILSNRNHQQYQYLWCSKVETHLSFKFGYKHWQDSQKKIAEITNFDKEDHLEFSRNYTLSSWDIWHIELHQMGWVLNSRYNNIFLILSVNFSYFSQQFWYSHWWYYIWNKIENQSWIPTLESKCIGPLFTKRHCLTSIGIPIINPWWSAHHLRFIKGIPIPIRWCLSE